MKNYYLLFFLLLFAFTEDLCAQKADSIFVKQYDNGWAIMHKVKEGETVFSIGRRYHIPPAMLADNNGLNYQSGLEGGRVLSVPLGAYNFINGYPEQMTDLRPIYFKAEDHSQLYRIARNSRVQQKTIQQWSSMFSTEVGKGDVLLVGWVLFDATPIAGTVPKEVPAVKPDPLKNTKPVAINNTKPVTVYKDGSKNTRDTTIVYHPANQPVRPPLKNPHSDTIIIVQRDTNTSLVDTAMTEAEKTYMQQTNNEQNVVMEKGPAAFFQSTAPANAEYYYGFHSIAPKGSFIKVFNPGTQKTILVKVLGPLPQSKLYHQCIIGISSAAKEALIVSEDKAWCEITYAGY